MLKGKCTCGMEYVDEYRSANHRGVADVIPCPDCFCAVELFNVGPLVDEEEPVIVRNCDMVGKTCNGGYELKVMRSGAGYYIGTFDAEFYGPNCRATGYFRTEEEALNSEFFPRDAVENCCDCGI